MPNVYTCSDCGYRIESLCTQANPRRSRWIEFDNAGRTRVYALGGMIRCDVRGRKFDSHWVNNRPGYRCRHGYHSAKARDLERPKTLYMREDWVPAELARWVADDGRYRWAEIQQMLCAKTAVVTAGSGGLELTVTVG